MELIDLAQDMEIWGGFCEHGNEPSGSVRLGEFLN